MTKTNYSAPPAIIAAWREQARQAEPRMKFISKWLAFDKIRRQPFFGEHKPRDVNRVYIGIDWAKKA